METRSLNREHDSRKLLPKDLSISGWDSISSFVKDLLEEDFQSPNDLETWLRKISEVESAFYEELAWRYIRMTCNTSDESLRNSYNHFVEYSLAPFKTEENKLRRKMTQSPFFSRLDPSVYKPMQRNMETSLKLFREVNVPLIGKVQTLAHTYGEVTGAMEVEHNGKKYTLPKAASFLEGNNREERETIWRKISERRLKDQMKLENLFDDLVARRQEIAANAGFKGFAEYSFLDLGRFDYSPQDCFRFHESVEKVIRPLYNEFQMDRKKRLGLDKLRPWDLTVDIFGEKPLRPFKNADRLIEGTRHILGRLDPSLGALISHLEKNGLLDLESRVGKAPGGYNYPLPETGLSFVFMNSVGSLGDLTTMVHEMGHATHADLMLPLELNEFRSTPSEVAELASMSMELLSLNFWDEFFSDPEELRRARYEQISRTITILPWIATVDAFQHWIYSNPGHTPEQRRKSWRDFYFRFHGNSVDWNGLENELGVLWQKQLHIFEAPFYYIEYAIAQLGAIAVWRNYKSDPAEAIAGYKRALSLGYTKTIPEIYSAAGIRFDFSPEYLSELAGFVMKELEVIRP